MCRFMALFYLPSSTSTMINIPHTSLAIACSFMISTSLSALATEKPNIVILFSDDAGYADFGFQPDCSEEMKKLTPNIDTIAKQGVRLTNGYMSASVCSPSRAGLMTGRYQQRFGYDNNLPPNLKNGLPLTEKFGAKYMQSLGYKTALIGKWHLGYPAEMMPNERGFDWFYGLLQGARRYFPINNVTKNQVILDNALPTKEAGYVTDRFGDAACKFISANKDNPFFLFVSFTAPHGPLQPREIDADRTAHIKHANRANYAGLIVSLDDNVGKILAQLKKDDLEKNTLVIFTNDNGGQTKTGANNAPLTGRKGTLLEGGIRVPWAMRWPGKIKSGLVIADPIISLDIIPTMLEMAGAKVKNEWKLDGISILKRITGKVDGLAIRPLFWRQHGSGGDRSIREGKWKIHHARSSGAAPKLYDLSSDISEQSDLASKHPDITKALLSKLDKWEAELVEPMWGPGTKGKVIRKKSRKNKRLKQ